jgi:hypothetical protein
MAVMAVSQEAVRTQGVMTTAGMIPRAPPVLCTSMSVKVRRARSMFLMVVGGAGVCGCFALGYNRIVCCAHVVQNFVTSSYDSNTVAAPVTFLDR